jgi:hypothetical protein
MIQDNNMRKIVLLLIFLVCSASSAGKWSIYERHPAAGTRDHVYGADISWEKTNNFEIVPAINLIRLWILLDSSKAIRVSVGLEPKHPFLIQAARNGFYPSKNDNTGITVERMASKNHELRPFLLILSRPEYNVPDHIIRFISTKLGV